MARLLKDHSESLLMALNEESPRENYARSKPYAYIQKQITEAINKAAPEDDTVKRLTKKKVSKKDIPADPLNFDQYFPSFAASPPKMETLQGVSFGELPVFTGGAALYPFSVSDAKRKAQFDYEQDMKEKVRNQLGEVKDDLKQLLFAPSDQVKANQWFNDHFVGFINHAFDSNDPETALALLSPGSPYYDEMFTGTYKIYENMQKSSLAIQDKYDQLQKDKQAGKVIDVPTEQTLNDWAQGKVSFADEMNLAQKLQSYESLHTYLFTHDASGKTKIGNWANEYLVKGAPMRVYDSKTGTYKEKIIPQAGNDILIAKLKEGRLPPEQFDDFAEQMMDDVTFDPSLRRNPNDTQADIDKKKSIIIDYLGKLPYSKEIAEVGAHGIYHPPAGSGGKDVNVIYTYNTPILSQYQKGKDSVFGAVTAIGGVNMGDKKINLDIPAPEEYIPTETGKWTKITGQSLMNVDVAGVYDFWYNPTSKKLYSTTDASELPGLKKAGYVVPKRFALVRGIVNEPDPHDKKNKVPVTHDMLIPYENVQSYLEKDYQLPLPQMPWPRKKFADGWARFDGTKWVKE